MKPNAALNDRELGMIIVRTNVRARRFTFRVRDGQLVVTAPASASLHDMLRAVDEMRPRLLQLLRRAREREAQHMVAPDFRIDTPDFTFHSEEARVPRMTVRQQRGSLTCYYPAGTDFSSGDVQRWLVNAIEESLRQHARVLFAPRLGEMARARDLVFRSMSIHKTRGRWGSCSSRGNINLSLYLLLLPHHLQDLVMQHELTHLVEMNHSPRFHALLDEAVGGREAEYEAELKRFDTNIFTLL